MSKRVEARKLFSKLLACKINRL